MPNNITLFKKYIDKLDEVYALSSRTAVLDTDPFLITQGANANEFIIPKMDMDGLGDYDRTSGYPSGSVTLTNETVKADYDRGRKFMIDSQDDEETAGVAFGRLSAEFLRTKVVPEMDAYRMAKYAAAADGPVEAALATGEEVLAALEVAVSKMDDAEVPAEDRYLFITFALLNKVKMLDTTKSREILDGFGGRIVTMPQSRFFTAIDLKNGKGGESAGGYEKAALGGKNINFLIVAKSAAIQFAKHIVSNIFSPKENQDADAWKFNYRSYGLCDHYENKVKGIYLHNAPGA